jgi:1-aminocyclopropane-1-carboxylate deaminase
MLSQLTPGNITIDTISAIFRKEVELSVLRLDKLHPLVSGNKWFKLRYYLLDARAQGKKNIITFGGAWSNHIIATAAACRMEGLNATGIIRGEEPAQLSATLQQAKEWGMQLVFLSRNEYREKKIPPALLTKDSYLINEGGYGEQGARGASTILEYSGSEFTHYCCAAGTGTMTAGLINAALAKQKIISISVLKNDADLEKRIASLLSRKDNPPQTDYELIHDYHFGGYAKHQPALLAFMNDFYSKTGIPTDFVYTAKLFYAVTDLIQTNFFPEGSKIMVIHSGGLQGNLSLPKGTLTF